MTAFDRLDDVFPRLLGQRFRDARLGHSWSFEGLARKFGYTRHVAKGAHRIEQAEQGVGGKEFLDDLAGVLGLHIAEIRSEIEEQLKEERKRWLSEWLEINPDAPVPSHMVVRCFAACYAKQRMPDDIETPAQAIEYARQFAARHGKKVCLPITPEVSVWFDIDGRVEWLSDAVLGQQVVPTMEIGRR